MRAPSSVLLPFILFFAALSAAADDDDDDDVNGDGSGSDPAPSSSSTSEYRRLMPADDSVVAIPAKRSFTLICKVDREEEDGGGGEEGEDEGGSEFLVPGQNRHFIPDWGHGYGHGHGHGHGHGGGHGHGAGHGHGGGHGHGRVPKTQSGLCRRAIRALRSCVRRPRSIYLDYYFYYKHTVASCINKVIKKYLRCASNDTNGGGDDDGSEFSEGSTSLGQHHAAALGGGGGGASAMNPMIPHALLNQMGMYPSGQQYPSHPGGQLHPMHPTNQYQAGHGDSDHSDHMEQMNPTGMAYPAGPNM